VRLCERERRPVTPSFTGVLPVVAAAEGLRVAAGVAAAACKVGGVTSELDVWRAAWSGASY